MSIQLAEQALSLYDLPRTSSVHLVSLSENETYKVEAPSGKRWALRLQRPGYQSKISLASEIAWLVALRKDGVVATPVPVVGLDGEWISRSCADCKTWFSLNGKTAANPKSHMDLRQCFEESGCHHRPDACAQQNMAAPGRFRALHLELRISVGGDAPMGSLAGRAGRECHPARSVRPHGGSDPASVFCVMAAHPDRFGLAHCDLRLANLLMHAGEVKVIDFDDCGFGWYMYDAATPLSFYEHLPQVPSLIEIWLEGYRTVRAIPKADEEEIPTFVMLRRLLLVAWVGSHVETDLARSLGVSFTDQTVALCSAYLRRFG